MSHFTRIQVFGTLLLVLAQLLFQIQPASGFAAWLKCYVDLLDEEEIIMNHEIVPASKVAHAGVEIEIKLAEDDDWSSTLSYPADTATIATARLKVPPSLAEQDVQFVMDTMTKGAAFKRPSTCEGRRASSTHYSHAVVLEIDGSTETVELVAGYAAGHEAVTLTPPLVLRRKSAGDEL